MWTLIEAGVLAFLVPGGSQKNNVFFLRPEAPSKTSFARYLAWPLQLRLAEGSPCDPEHSIPRQVLHGPLQPSRHRLPSFHHISHKQSIEFATSRPQVTC